MENTWRSMATRPRSIRRRARSRSGTCTEPELPANGTGHPGERRQRDQSESHNLAQIGSQHIDLTLMQDGSALAGPITQAWIDANVSVDRQVTFGSPAYFALAEDREARTFLQTGNNLLFRYQGEVIQVVDPEAPETTSILCSTSLVEPRAFPVDRAGPADAAEAPSRRCRAIPWRASGRSPSRSATSSGLWSPGGFSLRVPGTEGVLTRPESPALFCTTRCSYLGLLLDGRVSRRIMELKSERR